MELSKTTRKYWADIDFSDLEKSNNIKDLYLIAERIIDRMPKPISSVCGPIGTGGVGSVEGNLEIFNKNIIELQDRGINVFDQMPFEQKMQKFKISLGEEYCRKSIVDDFYTKIFESGFDSNFYFIKNWESSKGACWEHDMAKRLGIKINYL